MKLQGFWDRICLWTFWQLFAPLPQTNEIACCGIIRLLWKLQEDVILFCVLFIYFLSFNILLDLIFFYFCSFCITSCYKWGSCPSLCVTVEYDCCESCKKTAFFLCFLLIFHKQSNINRYNSIKIIIVLQYNSLKIYNIIQLWKL